ncbi:MAG: aminopeptidase P family protein [Planctomycetaceae bacterium]|nr:aminopeptidase P family protein [Planctomycetaceae bacterium]
MSFEIDPALCRHRQQRLQAEMRRRDIDLVIVAKTEHVQWLTGPRFGWVFEPLAALWKDGTCTLVAPNAAPPVHAADAVTTYEAQWLSTLRNDQRHAAVDALKKVLHTQGRARRIGVEYSCFPRHFGDRSIDELSDSLEIVDVEPALYHLRRRKDADELARIKHAIGATGAMYAKAREIMQPGLSELEMFNTLQATAVNYLGEMLTGTGNDYASGVPGGPPRPRKIEAGELYVLDLGPAFRGYFADNCRAIAVDGKPTPLQLSAQKHIAEVFAMVTEFVKPGASCRALFTKVKAHLDAFTGARFDHHLGHGIGLFPHEAPHLNSMWDDTFEVGDVFTAEPGLYSDELRGGIRLENDYVVTETGVELLSDFPLGLT